MSPEVFQELQENINQYFLDKPDIEVWAVVSTLVYLTDSDKDSKKEELSNKFLKEMGLEQIFLDYKYNIENRPKYFIRGNHDNMDFYEKVKSSLLGVVYNRWKNTI